MSNEAIMIMPNLLLQKPSKSSKSKDHQQALERRLELWTDGEFEELFHEGETIQLSLKTIQGPKTVAEISRKFKQLMTKGNVNAALNLLTENMENSLLPLDQRTISNLVLKHPDKKMHQMTS